MSKLCHKCNAIINKTNYAPSQFKKKNGWCKFCFQKYFQQNKEKKKKYYQDNEEKINSYKKIYRQNNTKFISNNNKKYRSKNKNKIALTKHKWYQNNKERVINNTRKSKSEKYIHDPNFKLRNRLSSEIRSALKNNNSSKNGHSILKYLPYTIENLKKNLESKFEHWMTWNNWGRYDAKKWDDNDQTTWTWQIDHIIPQSKLQYTSMEDTNFKKCWLLDNLRPYSAKQNIIDSNRQSQYYVA
jgi:hypothetical protein